MRDTGDGTAYKVDGVRGGVYVGQAGDVRGTKALDGEGDAKARSALEAYRAEVATSQPAAGFADVSQVPPPHTRIRALPSPEAPPAPTF